MERIPGLTPPQTQTKIDSYRKKQISQIKRSLLDSETRANQEKNIWLRTKWLKNQRQSNINNEYNRLIGALSNTNVPPHTMRNLEGGIKRLEKLGAKMFSID